MSTHLIIPDSHAKPDVKNDRYDWLGKLILDVKPDKIINLGDMADMYSLNEYEKGTKAFVETASYDDDIDAVREANERLWAPVRAYNKRMAKRGSKGYNPVTHMLLGNHENRIARVNKYQPHFPIRFEHLGYEEYYRHVHPFLEKVNVDGVNYCHCIQSRNSSMMIGGKFQANSMIAQEHCSTTVGHSHILDFKDEVDGAGKRILGLSAGCYFEHFEKYANQSNPRWWRGIVLKHNVRNGMYDPQFIRLETVKREYK